MESGVDPLPHAGGHEAQHVVVHVRQGGRTIVRHPQVAAVAGLVHEAPRAGGAYLVVLKPGEHACGGGARGGGAQCSDGVDSSKVRVAQRALQRAFVHDGHARVVAALAQAGYQ